MESGKGFTLAEALIVMGIVVVMAAAAIPSMSGQVETARNMDRETRISAAVYDAYLYALKGGGATVAAPMPSAILDDMRDYVKTADLSVSFGAKTVTVTAANLPASADRLEGEFVKDATKTFQLSRIRFYNGSSELTPISAT